ncbi:MAG: hypothetical protein JO041_04435 [Acidobacteria bacterium]|nr:hypothetical protein [Acidobacteriota bacterium]
MEFRLKDDAHRRMAVVCLLLVFLLLVAALHVHNDRLNTEARPCITCLSLQCALVVSIALVEAGQVLRRRAVLPETELRFSPLHTSELYVRPPPHLS